MRKVIVTIFVLSAVIFGFFFLGSNKKERILPPENDLSDLYDLKLLLKFDVNENLNVFKIYDVFNKYLLKMIDNKFYFFDNQLKSASANMYMGNLNACIDFDDEKVKFFKRQKEKYYCISENLSFPAVLHTVGRYKVFYYSNFIIFKDTLNEKKSFMLVVSYDKKMKFLKKVVDKDIDLSDLDGGSSIDFVQFLYWCKLFNLKVKVNADNIFVKLSNFIFVDSENNFYDFKSKKVLSFKFLKNKQIVTKFKDKVLYVENDDLYVAILLEKKKKNKITRKLLGKKRLLKKVWVKNCLLVNGVDENLIFIKRFDELFCFNLDTLRKEKIVKLFRKNKLFLVAVRDKFYFIDFRFHNFKKFTLKDFNLLDNFDFSKVEGLGLYGLFLVENGFESIDGKVRKIINLKEFEKTIDKIIFLGKSKGKFFILARKKDKGKIYFVLFNSDGVIDRFEYLNKTIGKVDYFYYSEGTVFLKVKDKVYKVIVYPYFLNDVVKINEKNRFIINSKIYLKWSLFDVNLKIYDIDREFNLMFSKQIKFALYKDELLYVYTDRFFVYKVVNFKEKFLKLFKKHYYVSALKLLKELYMKGNLPQKYYSYYAYLLYILGNREYVKRINIDKIKDKYVANYVRKLNMLEEVK